ncbi:aspartyl protease [Prochlorothrix hollandica PCC 9006 = CALU 1027]|uniref:Aspartyl protease n=2 Tax=Prochlorothrix hollandica TaxID=1223 RepID=A0A0M2PWI4_PROHO|nr:aspartyl protease [Prochlorothrix hollandica PCC 9006 = CALU 1027]KKI99031.1 aspartyl protease [Prochlorothrix hollandica PCC 9006 = CALU 1027]
MTTIVDFSERVMGKVHTVLTVINRADQIRLRDGTIAADAVRSIDLREVLVDTGATTLCLPPELIARLGLDLLKEVEATTATGVRSVRIFQDAKICLCGREGTFECLELPGGLDPLLGVIPLEMLGLEPDLKHQRLRVLPEQSVDTYLTIL